MNILKLKVDDGSTVFIPASNIAFVEASLDTATETSARIGLIAGPLEYFIVLEDAAVIASVLRGVEGKRG